MREKQPWYGFWDEICPDEEGTGSQMTPPLV
jgi:hypothetical protein